MEKKFVNMHGDTFSEPVLVDSWRWNGWAVPVFTEEQFPALLEFMNKYEFSGSPFNIGADGIEIGHINEFCCNPLADEFLECVCVCFECVEVWLYEDLDGVKVCRVGGGAWCWSTETYEERAEILSYDLSDEIIFQIEEILMVENERRTGERLTLTEFIVLMHTGNGWDLTDPKEFSKSVNCSALCYTL